MIKKFKIDKEFVGITALVVLALFPLIAHIVHIDDYSDCVNSQYYWNYVKSNFSSDDVHMSFFRDKCYVGNRYYYDKDSSIFRYYTIYDCFYIKTGEPCGIRR